MKTGATAVTIVLSGAFYLYGGTNSTPSSNSPAKSVATNGAPVIGYLEQRGHLVTIMAGKGGPLYTIKTKDGATVAERINDAQLQASHPEVYRDVKTGIAGNDAMLHRKNKRSTIILLKPHIIPSFHLGRVIRKKYWILSARGPIVAVNQGDR